ncbi:hypothetical protein [Microcoleus sp. LEGE 07076]|nr:hypothetical protein [Microcoleus sp. LEGE 07076]
MSGHLKSQAIEVIARPARVQIPHDSGFMVDTVSNTTVRDSVMPLE